MQKFPRDCSLLLEFLGRASFLLACPSGRVNLEAGYSLAILYDDISLTGTTSSAIIIFLFLLIFDS